MAIQIEDLEGIGPKIGETLRGAGIATAEALLKSAATGAGRKELAAKTGLNEKNLLKWANLADLCRIKGVSTQYSELLEAAGVDTVKELATRNAPNLAQKIREINETKKLARQAPSENTVADWIAQAKTLPAMITH